MTVYLDNAATSHPKPQVVYEAVMSYMQNIGVSPGRGTYREARQAEEIVLNTRALIRTHRKLWRLC
jgi:selenocysteine lyase/cysteine desulfurase